MTEVYNEFKNFRKYDKVRMEYCEELFKILGPVAIEKIVLNSKEKVDFEDEDLYFGELPIKNTDRDLEYYHYKYLYNKYLVGEFIYIGMISKKT